MPPYPLTPDDHKLIVNTLLGTRMTIADAMDANNLSFDELSARGYRDYSSINERIYQVVRSRLSRCPLCDHWHRNGSRCVCNNYRPIRAQWRQKHVSTREAQ